MAYFRCGGVKKKATQTYTATSRGAALDMGADNEYRYVNTNGVPNSNSDTYVANSRGAALDMGATNTNRYVNTNNVPNTNSGTYTYPANSTGGTYDMGATNTNRYVNAQNVYSKGVADGKAAGTPIAANTFTYAGWNSTLNGSMGGKSTYTVGVAKSFTFYLDIGLMINVSGHKRIKVPNAAAVVGIKGNNATLLAWSGTESTLDISSYDYVLMTRAAGALNTYTESFTVYDS